MSYISSSAVSIAIPCVHPGCLANRIGSSSTCIEHRPAPSGRQQVEKRIKHPTRSPIVAQGDNGNTRPRTLRFVNADDVAVSRAIHSRRLSEDDATALGRFLKTQREVPSGTSTPTHHARSHANRLSSDRQQNLEKLLMPRPTPDQLRSRNIMKDDVPASFHERVRSLEMQLGTRSPRENLVDQRIIVDTSNGVQARGDSLQRLLERRSSPDALTKKNILKVSSDLSRFNPEAGDASAAIGVESPKERLERMLKSRPTAKSLVAKNILKQTSPVMADRQRRLDLHQRQNSLSDKLRHRPSSQQLKDLGIIEEEDEKASAAADADSKSGKDETAKRPDEDDNDGDSSTVFVPALPVLTPDLKSAARVGDSTQFQHVLFVWGQGHHGQLGLNNSRSQPFPTLCRALGHLQIRVVVLGAQHTLALSGDGELFGWGSCARGQLGLGEGAADMVRSPTSLHVSHSPLCNQRAELIAAGAFHSAFTLVGTGGVFVMGSGMAPGGDVRIPVMTPGLEGTKFEHLACGRQHCAAVASNGDLWTWGRGSEGQLGRGPQADGDLVGPGRIETHTEFWAAVVCGGDHTAAVGYDQCMYVWGDNSLGQLGLPGFAIPGHVFEPQQVKALARKGIVQIACSQNHTTALSDNGTIYSTTIVPRSDTGSNFIRLPPMHCFTNVAAGINLTTATTAGGVIYLWQMDQGSLQSQRITTLEGIDLTNMSGGYRHFAALGRVPAGTLDPVQMERKFDGIAEEEVADEDSFEITTDARKPQRKRADKHKRHETLVHIEPEMRSVQQD